MHEDKRGTTPVMFAKKHNRNQIVELMVQHGAVVSDGKKKAAPAKAVQPKLEEK